MYQYMLCVVLSGMLLVDKKLVTYHSTLHTTYIDT